MKRVGKLLIDINNDNDRREYFVNGGVEQTDVYLCDRCKALVADPDGHMTWHRASSIGVDFGGFGLT